MNREQTSLFQSTASVVGRSIPSLVEQDDTSLVRCSQRGDQGAFALLVQRHQRRVFLLSVHLLQNPEDANEATQEVFVAAWQDLPRFRGDVLFSSWLSRIAYRCCLHVLDQRTREQFVQADVQEERTSSTTDKQQQAMETIERHDQHVMGSHDVAHMPATSRVVLHFRFLRERMYKEMAHMLPMPRATITTTLIRSVSLHTIVKALSDQSEDDNERRFSFCSGGEGSRSTQLSSQKERREKMTLDLALVADVFQSFTHACSGYATHGTHQEKSQ